MDSAAMILVNKYAQAFLNVYSSCLTTVDESTVLATAAEYLKQHVRFMTLLHVATISAQDKKKLLATYFQEWQVQPIFMKLVDLLLAKQRLYLLPAVLIRIVQKYQQQNNFQAWTIASSTALESCQQKKIIKFLEHTMHTAVIPTFVIDSTLLAGIRMQSKHYLWEHSLRQRLNNIYKMEKS